MRRSTAAAVGTLTGAALILGVRLSVTPAPLAAPPAFEAQPVGDTGAVTDPPATATRDGARGRPTERAGGEAGEQATTRPGGDDPDAEDPDAEDRGAEPTPTRTGGRSAQQPSEEAEAPAGGLRDGTYTGTAATNPYGTVQVRITVSDGRISKVAANYPTTGQSGSINAAAIPRLKEATVEAQSADIDAVSGATFTSESYITSLQAALDGAAR
ncbi:MAG TPA: FMN-binding protein [Actinoplanes sp.]|nr:FMN-binding protein [Actinoplanes sp.]